MSYSYEHLIVMPIVLPLVSAALMLLIDERNRSLRAAINVASTLILLGVAVALLRFADTPTANASGSVGVYLLGNWSAPFGIVLVADRLSALMLVLTSILALAALVFSIARWHRVGVHFHVLVQFLLLGLNGAFLTGDLFNLFVFFEVLLAASYGLVLHGSGALRGQSGLALHCDQFGHVLVVSDWCQPHLWRHRNAEHGGSRRAHPRHSGRRQDAARSGGRQKHTGHIPAFDQERDARMAAPASSSILSLAAMPGIARRDPPYSAFRVP